jgi:hypothetical protein
MPSLLLLSLLVLFDFGFKLLDVFVALPLSLGDTQHIDFLLALHGFGELFIGRLDLMLLELLDELSLLLAHLLGQLRLTLIKLVV